MSQGDRYEAPRPAVIVVAASSSAADSGVLEHAARLARGAAARVVIAHVPQGVDYEGTGDPSILELRQDVEIGIAARAITTFDPIGVAWSLVVRSGHWPAVIGDLARAHQAIFVLVGSPRPGMVAAARRILTWTVPSRLLRVVRCPVVIVPRRAAMDVVDANLIWY